MAYCHRKAQWSRGQEVCTSEQEVVGSNPARVEFYPQTLIHRVNILIYTPGKIF